MKRETKLYNVMFPVWFLLILPASWIVVIPANFVIDLLVLFLTMKFCKMPDIGKNLKSAVLKTWILGFAADLIGAAGMFLAGIGGDYLPGAFGEWFMEHIGNAVVMNPFETVGGFLWTAFFVALAGFFIYLFNLKFPTSFSCPRRCFIKPRRIRNDIQRPGNYAGRITGNLPGF